MLRSKLLVARGWGANKRARPCLHYATHEQCRIQAYYSATSTRLHKPRMLRCSRKPCTGIMEHLSMPPGLGPSPLAISILLIVASIFFYNRRRARYPSADSIAYAFSASTKIRRRRATVLPFAARVPMGSGAPPTIVRTFGVQSSPMRAGDRYVTQIGFRVHKTHRH